MDKFEILRHIVVERDYELQCIFLKKSFWGKKEQK